MSYYHIIIAQERRTPIVTDLGEDRSRLAIQITAEAEQLHSMGQMPANIGDPQFVMVAEWDGQSSYVICHKGDYSARNMHYAGWPDVTKEQYEANMTNQEDAAQ